ncbi:MAG TPA: MFS transporter [Casimicrobiaceae bacterium]|nr:MFS transporter [Casimicrobiaceae bacterium]
MISDEGNVWMRASLLWLAGNTLRLTILAVPAVIAIIRDDFGLNATQVGLLSSIPPALFALASLAGSLLVARLGLMRAIIGGLLLIAIGGALRGVSPGYGMLFVTTIVMALGVAIMQPIMPSAVRQWLPQRIGLGTAIYTNGLLVGEILPVWLTIPLILPAVSGSWRMALAAWSIPVLVIVIVMMLFAPRTAAAQPAQSAGVPTKWLPDWHRGLVWRLGAIFWCITGIYFTSNAFIPIYLKSAGRADLIGDALTALNLGQLPASFLLLGYASKLERRAWPYIVSAVVSLVCVAGLALSASTWTIVWAALLGFSDAAAFILALTLPALLCAPQDVARTAAGTFSLAYGGAMLTAIVSGVAWDASGIPALAYVPIGICALALGIVPGMMRRRGDLR